MTNALKGMILVCILLLTGCTVKVDGFKRTEILSGLGQTFTIVEDMETGERWTSFGSSVFSQAAGPAAVVGGARARRPDKVSISQGVNQEQDASLKQLQLQGQLQWQEQEQDGGGGPPFGPPHWD